MKNDIFKADKYQPGNDVELLRSGGPFFSRLLKIIDEAQSLIYFQVYIFEDDVIGKAVAAALKKARLRGVEIFLLLDSYGSRDLPYKFIEDLKAAGIEFRFFSPLPKYVYTFRLGRRLHSKVVVVDQAVALVGGINIADKYHGSDLEDPWLDFAVQIRGPVCLQLTQICARIFNQQYFKNRKNSKQESETEQAGSSLTRLALNDFLRRKSQISKGYKGAFMAAEHSITIVASYFLPGYSLRRALKMASRRGVKINVLLPGKSDMPMAKRASRFLYHWLWRFNVEVYEWEKSILHGKLAVVDRKWATVGSYNLNHLSKYSSIEMNIEVLDAAFANKLDNSLAELLEQADRVLPDSDTHPRSIYDRILDWASYVLGRWIMLFLFFLIKRDFQTREEQE